MPASEEEIEEGLVEGIKMHPSLGPKQFVGSNGKLTGLEVISCTSVFDAQHRFSPTFAAGTETIIPCDTVILAIGQASDLSFLKPGDGIETTRQGTLKIDPATLMTTAPGIFAAGDVAFGPRLIINAVADGKKAAEEIDKFIRGPEWKPKPQYRADHRPRSSQDGRAVRRIFPLGCTGHSSGAPHRHSRSRTRLYRRAGAGEKLRVAFSAGSIPFSKGLRRTEVSASSAAAASTSVRKIACSSCRSANSNFPMKPPTVVRHIRLSRAHELLHLSPEESIPPLKAR